MAKNVTFSTLLVVAVAAVLMAEAPSKAAAACDPTQLLPCAGAFMSSDTPPSGECCAKLKQQKPCLCEYKKNPKYQSYVTSPSARRIASACKLTVDC